MIFHTRAKINESSLNMPKLSKVIFTMICSCSKCLSVINVSIVYRPLAFTSCFAIPNYTVKEIRNRKRSTIKNLLR